MADQVGEREKHGTRKTSALAGAGGDDRIRGADGVLPLSAPGISDAKLKDVTAAVTKTLDTKAMQESDAQMIKRLYGLNPADYEGITLYYPVTNMDAEELLIVQLKDVSQQETVKAAIDARLETQKNSFEGYGVEQYALLEKSVVDVEGNYILFVVNEQAAKAQSAFLQAL